MVVSAQAKEKAFNLQEADAHDRMLTLTLVVSVSPASMAMDESPSSDEIGKELAEGYPNRSRFVFPILNIWM